MKEDKSESHYAEIGRAVESERKRKAEDEAKEAAKKADDEHLAEVIGKALKDNEKRQRDEAKKKLQKAVSQGLGAALLFGGIAFYGSLLESEMGDNT